MNEIYLFKRNLVNEKYFPDWVCVCSIRVGAWKRF